MKLAKPFYRLPVLFDARKLREEVEALPAAAWAKHPNHIKGNHSLRLISVDGEENDDVDGVMQPTAHLLRSPYMCQLLASFGVVWSRSRLLKLEPFVGVPQHADINYHWFYRVRLHVPIVTHPDIRFFCGTECVHMAAGEAWIFDNWRLHRVDNPTPTARIHLVADTSGSASFWQFVAQGDTNSTVTHEYRHDATRDARLLTEHSVLASVMPPAEVDLLLADFQADLHSTDAKSQDQQVPYCGMLDAFRRDWRQLYQLFGENPAGLPEYTKLRDSVRRASKEHGSGLIMRSNRIPAHTVLEGRVLRVLSKPRPAALPDGSALRRPIFIVAAPRSGSTLLFETLAASEQIFTLGGEAHWLVESIAALRPGAPGIDSNRLGAMHCTGEIAERIKGQILAQSVNSCGRRSPFDGSLRFLEKTPKNALRVPFFNKMFPDALFVFLWRDPRENLNSIMEAWRSGNFKTYQTLEGFDGPWSLLLPPGWQNLRGKPLEEIAAFQWDAANGILLDDLEVLAPSRWTAVHYADLIADPLTTIRRLCACIGVAFDDQLAERTASALPLSRFTQTPPEPGKWLRNEAAIARVMPGLRKTWQRLQNLKPVADTSEAGYSPKR